MAKIKTKSALQKMKDDAAEIVKEAKKRERQILEKIREEEKEVYAEIGKKAVALFNRKISEDDFKNFLKKHEMLDEVEEVETKNDESKNDFSSENKNKNIGMGAQHDL